MRGSGLTPPAGQNHAGPYPGLASTGRVAPIVCRTAATAAGPSQAIAITGAEVMYLIRPFVKWFSFVNCVMGFGKLL